MHGAPIHARLSDINGTLLTFQQILEVIEMDAPDVQLVADGGAAPATAFLLLQHGISLGQWPEMMGMPSRYIATSAANARKGLGGVYFPGDEGQPQDGVKGFTLNNGSSVELVRLARRIYERKLRQISTGTVSKLFTHSTRPDRFYVSRSHQMAVLYCVYHAELHGLRLVHGTANLGVGERGEYAWVELPGDLCFDAVVQRFLPRKEYYRAFALKARVTYDMGQVREMAADVQARRRFGPWDTNPASDVSSEAAQRLIGAAAFSAA